uniref:Putative ovule protein n=1 Tax=Solanum chacoense TaxID=4108 RepID=A0A0V0HL16_SOLCH
MNMSCIGICLEQCCNANRQLLVYTGDNINLFSERNYSSLKHALQDTKRYISRTQNVVIISLFILLICLGPSVHFN